MDIDLSAGLDRFDALDAGLAAGFGREHESVLDVIARRVGARPHRVSLPGASDETAAPLSTSSPALRAILPQGRTNYSLHGEIARGGMGVILKGHDGDLGREVALKVLRADLARDPDVVQRFVEEAQIGGQLQHPGIVPVYELGVMSDQRPYFAMKLIKGRTLAALLGEKREASPRRLLDIFAAVCQTVAYAHSRGVVHRDLKPANVLIGAFGEVQVVDWGLAKVLNQGGVHDERRARDERTARHSVVHTARSRSDSVDSLSRYGSVMGTPAYMPPEQARGEVHRLDERSDVFSLGAILCEILTGAPPYTGEGERTIVQAADARLEDATQRLDACAADRELVALCRNCLAPRQSDRPRSAAALAESIQAHLASVEERAQRAEVEAAEAKLKARSTVLLSAAGIAFLFFGGGGWLWMSEQRSQRVSATASSVSSALQEVAMARGRGDWAAAATAMERARARLDVPDADATLRARVASLGEILDRELADTQNAQRLERDNSQLLAALEEIRQPDGGEIYPTDWKTLDQQYHAVFASQELVIDGTETALTALRARGIDLEISASLDEWSSVRRNALDVEGARNLRRIADALDGDPTRRRLRAALNANDMAVLREIAAATIESPAAAPTAWLLAHALVQAGQFDVALPLLQAARRRFPQDFKLALELARALRAVVPSRMRDALPHYEAALALRPERVAVWHDLGQTLAYLKRDADALAVFERAVERLPNDAHLHHHVGNALTNLGRHEDALHAFARALELAPDFGPSHNDRGAALEKLGRYEEALASFQRAGELAPELRQVSLNIAITNARLERYDVALEHIEHAQTLDSTSGEPQFWRGFFLSQLERHDEAIESFHECIAVRPDHDEVHVYLGAVLLRTGRAGESLAAFEEAARINPSDPRAHSAIATALLYGAGEALGDAERAWPHIRKLIELTPENDLAHELLGAAQFVRADYSESLASFERAIELGGTSSERGLFVGLCHARLGEPDSARRELASIEAELDDLQRRLPSLHTLIGQAQEMLER